MITMTFYDLEEGDIYSPHLSAGRFKVMTKLVDGCTYYYFLKNMGNGMIFDFNVVDYQALSIVVDIEEEKR